MSYSSDEEDLAYLSNISKMFRQLTTRRSTRPRSSQRNSSEWHRLTGSYLSSADGSRSRSGSASSDKYSRRWSGSEAWGPITEFLPTEEVGGSLCQSMHINNDKFTKNLGIPFFGKWYRTLMYHRDCYIRLTLVPTRVTKTTGSVYGVRLNAEWTENDDNIKHFFIPTRYVEEDRFPIKMMVELWDRATYSNDNYVASHVVDLRPSTDAPDFTRKLTVKLKEGLNFIGALSMNITYTENLSDEQRKQLFVSLQNGALKKLDKRWTFGVIECEVRHFQGTHPDKNNFKKSIPYVLSITGLVATTVFMALLFYYLEDWPLLKASYFALVSLTSVGYGDFAPETGWGKFAAAIFAIVSNLALLTCITTLSHIVMQQRHLKKQKKMDSERRLKMLHEHCVEETNQAEIRMRTFQRIKTTRILKVSDVTDVGEPRKKLIDSAGEWRELLFFFVISLLWQGIWTLYFVYFAKEKMEWMEATYFGIITSTTVGYGDFHADGQEDRWMFISFTILFGVAVWGNMAGVLSIYLDRAMSDNDDLDVLLERALNTIDDIKSFGDAEDCGSNLVSQREFLQAMLVQMGLVDASIIQMLNDRFHEYGGEDNVIDLTEMRAIRRSAEKRDKELKKAKKMGLTVEAYRERIREKKVQEEQIETKETDAILET